MISCRKRRLRNVSIRTHPATQCRLLTLTVRWQPTRRRTVEARAKAKVERARGMAKEAVVVVEEVVAVAGAEEVGEAVLLEQANAT